MRRVVISGVGPVSSIGIGSTAYADALRAGRSGVSPIAGFDTEGFPYVMGGEVHDFDPGLYLTRLKAEEWGRASLFAAAAARLAVADAGISEAELATAAAGSCMGTTAGESGVLERVTEESLAAGGFGGVPPEWFRQVSAARLSLAVNRELELTADAVTLSNACSASNYALGYGYDLIRTGELDYAVVGGADSVMRWSHAGFYRLGALAERVCAPFDRDRSGIITAEGGAGLFLESRESAEARGARVYAEVLGYGMNCDAHHMVVPERASVAECMRLAHRNAGIEPADVDYICAHGTGTETNDLTEAGAVGDVFGAQPPPISSVKSMLGHTMGAASGHGAIAAALAITHSFLPPTINFSTADPEMAPVDPVANIARQARVDIAQINGFAFGGNNAIVILGRPS
ncbi:beta-ketoacyl-[acyl-carrier-protein] synthase family protein [Amycolatopsis aidingensis]|uniref:beta-ketoacyl-[acyl-carrier-protein] synthase family protein n=1 Tax=Amycolatopsis aidingensis TaxID=2842453 RepID=UPI001C0AEC8F|nr:beta-ketoacyl-[acyl-carrier-protein] synthase family protein [Amycolatopsis aidingensis]